jgi:type I site-specific restriction endonuclease
MKVTKKDAADMAGVGRTTFYRHIEEKRITIDPDGRIDVAELARIYGNIMTLEQAKAAKRAKKEPKPANQELSLELELKRLREALETSNLERKRERDQYTDQIEHLKSSLEKSMSQNEGLTRLLTDERSKEEKLVEQVQSEQNKQLDLVLNVVRELQATQNEKKIWWPFGKRA